MGVGYCCLSLGRMDDAGAALDEAIGTQRQAGLRRSCRHSR